MQVSPGSNGGGEGQRGQRGDMMRSSHFVLGEGRPSSQTQESPAEAFPQFPSPALCPGMGRPSGPAPLPSGAGFRPGPSPGRSVGGEAWPTFTTRMGTEGRRRASAAGQGQGRLRGLPFCFLKIEEREQQQGEKRGKQAPL